jgi:hypothetical protein
MLQYLFFISETMLPQDTDRNSSNFFLGKGRCLRGVVPSEWFFVVSIINPAKDSRANASDDEGYQYFKESRPLDWVNDLILHKISSFEMFYR